MNRARLAILGSCVTRDAINAAVPADVVCYRARTNAVSLLADPVNLPSGALEALPNNFARNCLRADFDKSTLSDIVSSGATHVILDFIDERFGLLRCGRQAVTDSDTLRQSGLATRLKAGGFTESQCASLDAENERLDAWQRVLAVLCKHFSPERIIIHAARHLAGFRTKAGAIRPFEAEAKRLIGVRNPWIKKLVVAATQHVVPRNMVDVSTGLYADEAHVWGLTPYHYEAAYYERFRAALLPILAA